MWRRPLHHPYEDLANHSKIRFYKTSTYASAISETFYFIAFDPWFSNLLFQSRSTSSLIVIWSKLSWSHVMGWHCVICYAIPKGISDVVQPLVRLDSIRNLLYYNALSKYLQPTITFRYICLSLFFSFVLMRHSIK